jgi:hypothetical protein
MRKLEAAKESLPSNPKCESGLRNEFSQISLNGTIPIPVQAREYKFTGRRGPLHEADGDSCGNDSAGTQ